MTILAIMDYGIRRYQIPRISAAGSDYGRSPVPAIWGRAPGVPFPIPLTAPFGQNSRMMEPDGQMDGT